MKFYIGLHQVHHARHFERCMISVARLARRVSDFPVNEWIMDSGAFSEIMRHGEFRLDVPTYARLIQRWATCGNLVAAVSQDYMCEAPALAATGLRILDHQRLTIERYDALRSIATGVYILPVLQGYDPEQYLEHLRQYGSRLAEGAWVGVGSVCKRNARPAAIQAVLDAILSERPDLRLHGFGVKTTALNVPAIATRLASADSMAWSFAARREGRDANSWEEAEAFRRRIVGRWSKEGQ